MADPEHFKILKQGPKIFNQWRKGNPDIKPNLIRADLTGTYLRGADLTSADLSEANLTEADLVGAYLRETNLTRVDLSGANLTGADLREVNLAGMGLRKVNLNDAYLGGANLTKTDLSGAYLGEVDLTGADLTGADLSRASLIKANLNEASLSEAFLRGANLTRAYLRNAILTDAVLIAAYLIEADLRGANLSRADLSGADLSEANLNETILRGADLRDVKLLRTIITAIDMRDVKGLETIRHFGPSSIGIDTIFTSAGKIPNMFLEDAGVPDIFIEYMGSLTGQAFQFYSSFISYSNNDKEFAERLYADLRKEGVRCWFAPEDIKGGEKIHRQLDEAIKLHDKLLLILSEKSINSDWVANEIKWARKREKQDGKQKLFPVRLIDFKILKDWELFDADTATDLAAEVRSYFIPDFTNWKNHDDYMDAFKGLLRGLQSEA